MDTITQITLPTAGLSKVLDGSKTIISCWLDDRNEYEIEVQRSATVHLNASDKKTIARALVSDVLEIGDLTPERVHDILDFYGLDDGIAASELHTYKKKLGQKKHCVLIFIESVEIVAPLEPKKSRKNATVTWMRRRTSSTVKRLGWQS